MKQRKSIGRTGLIAAGLGLMLMAAPVVWGAMQYDVHPRLTEQEKLIACADCHSEATPKVEKEWFDSVHGIAMVKCYQCHGTFGEFMVTPTRDNCATCHADMLKKDPQDKPCWECHVPHSFKAE